MIHRWTTLLYLLSTIINSFILMAISQSVIESEAISSAIVVAPLPPPRVNTSGTCILTISAWNNFGFVQTFFKSAHAIHPEITCLVWGVADSPGTEDEVKKYLAFLTPEIRNIFTIVPSIYLEKLVDFTMQELAMKFDLVEFSTTVKPLMFRYVFEVMKAEIVMFFDNDVWITDYLDEIVSHLRYRSCVLTPHIIEPIPMDKLKQTDLQILRAGIMNFGFVAFSNTPATLKFLVWWSQRLRFYGYVDLAKGMHFDQNWSNFIPAFFDHEDYFVFRDPRYNIAYWNLHYTGKTLKMVDGMPHINGQKTVFIHFSGVSLFEEYDIEGISRHQSRYTLKDFPDMRAVIQAYIDRVLSTDVTTFRKVPYGYKKFSDGTPVPSIYRQYFKELYDICDALSPGRYGISNEVKSLFHDLQVYRRPFEAPSVSSNCVKVHVKDMTYIDWMLKGPYSFVIDFEGRYYFSEIEYTIFKVRKDVQKVYPDPIKGDSYFGFKEWFYRYNGYKDYGLEGFLIKRWRKTYFQNLKSSLQKEKSFGINVLGWHNGNFGVGIAANHIFNDLKAVDAPVRATLLFGSRKHRKFQSNRLDVDDISRSPEYPINIVIANADFTETIMRTYSKVIWNEHYNIGVWAWELEIFPEAMAETAKHYDELWVPSTFIKKSLDSSKSLTPTMVMPIGLPDKYFHVSHPDVKKTTYQLPSDIPLSISTTAFMFLCIFDFNSAMDRKNPIGVVKAFKEAFNVKRSSDGGGDIITKETVLVLKAGPWNIHFNEERSELLRCIGGDPRIYFIEESLEDDDLDKLFLRADSYVSLHRSEGFGLNILQALARGKATIATNYGGCTDFFDDPLIKKAHHLIPYTLVPIANNYKYNPYQIKDAQWAEPDMAAAVKAMREVISQDMRDMAYYQMMKTVSNTLKQSFGSSSLGNRMMDRLYQAPWKEKVVNAISAKDRDLVELNMNYVGDHIFRDP